MEGITIRSIRTDRLVCLRSVEHSSRIVYYILLGRIRKITAADVSEGVSKGQRSVRSVGIVKCFYAPLRKHFWCTFTFRTKNIHIYHHWAKKQI